MANALQATGAPAQHLWLVGRQGNNITGGISKIVLAGTKPSGWDSVTDLGSSTQSRSTLGATLATALVSLPTGIAIQSSYNIPGVGKVPVHGPGGIAGALDSTATTAGNTAQSAVGALSLFGNISFWLRLAEGIIGAALIFLGLRAMTGGSGNPVELASSVASKVRPL